jgi:CubicO group peptidase (beta-lactamase class C family)
MIGMSRSRAATVLRLTLIVGFSVFGQTITGKQLVRDELNQYMERITQRGFSGAILVARDGKVILSKGYGDLGPRGGQVTADSVFDLASVTKQLTAAAILKLEMQTRLTPSDRISKYLSGVPKDKEQMTIHHLLTHTAGIPDDFGGDYDVAPRDETVQKILAAPLDSAPGEKYAYSNAGYSLLAALVEKISGTTWEEFTRKYLFQPSHMKDTGYKWPHWERSRVAESFLPVRFPSPLDRPGPYWNLLGNGGVLSTIGDLYRWHLALNGNSVLSAAEKKKLLTPYVLETSGGPTSYGYGWVIQKTNRGTTLAWHNWGSDEGFTSYIGRYLDEDAVIIFLSNSVLSGGVLPIAFAAEALENILFGGKYAIPPPAVPVTETELRRYEGTYRMDSGGSFAVSIKNGSLALQSQGRDAVAVLMYPEAERSPSPMTDRIKAVFDSMSRDDFGPLGGLAGPQAAADHVKRFGTFWRDWEAKVGRYQGTQVLFVTPTGSRMSTYLQLNFEKGNQVIRAAQHEDGPVSFSRVSLSAKSSFLVVPAGRGQFSYFDFRSGKNVVIQFPTTNDGHASAMVLRLTQTEMRIPAARN